MHPPKLTRMIARHHIPNLLTFGRVAAVPACLLLILAAPAQHGVLFLIFAAAAITDFFDGHLARKWNATSAIGTLLDPIADKLLVALLLLYLMQHYGLSLVPVSLMLLRELYISGLREFLASRQIALPVSKGGKLKTTLQLAGIGLMLFGAWWRWQTAISIGDILLWAAALVSVATAVQYSVAARQSLR